MADINERAIASVVQSAADGMTFFQDIVDIMTADGKHLHFLTPKIGFLMEQYIGSQIGAQTVLRFRQPINPGDSDVARMKVKFTKYLDAIDASDSKSGIAPNVIHAMDATHLCSPFCGASTTASPTSWSSMTASPPPSVAHSACHRRSVKRLSNCTMVTASTATCWPSAGTSL